jgi:hypothetical protein
VRTRTPPYSTSSRIAVLASVADEPNAAVTAQCLSELLVEFEANRSTASY